MNRNNFRDVNKIIERESKTASYKFALLRGTIDIAEKYDHLLRKEGDRVVFPMGLLVEKWLTYYYPLLATNKKLRHTTNGNLAFESEFKEIIEHFETRDGGFPSFYNQLLEGKYPEYLNGGIHSLTEKIRQTIKENPMKYIGSSLEKNVHYSIYSLRTSKQQVRKTTPINHEVLVRKFGEFSIPFWFYETLRYFGSFISGQESLLMQWAEFTFNINKGASVSKNQIIAQLLESPEEERNVREMEKILINQNKLYCIWSGKQIYPQKLNIDHCIPFSVYFNNDLWNLLPSHAAINSKKSDHIPSPELIDKQKQLLLDHWGSILNHEEFSPRFKDEMELSLTGSLPQSEKDLEKAHQSLISKCHFYIEEKGMTPFEG